MKDQIVLSNSEVADIYQNMLNGEKNSLYKLQQISFKHHIPRFIDSHYNKKTKNNTEEDIVKEQEQNQSEHNQNRLQQAYLHETNSLINTAKKKQQLYFNVIKKGAKFTSIAKNQNIQKGPKQRRWLNSSNNKYQVALKEEKLRKSQNKEMAAGQKDLSVEIKTNMSFQSPVLKNNNIYALPKVPKVKQLYKVQSTQMEPIKKNITISQHQKTMKQIKKVQKIDFKQKIGKNKKQKFDLQKKNEEQRKLQIEIMQYHGETKRIIQLVKERFELNFSNKHKYLKKKKKSEVGPAYAEAKQTFSTQKLSPFKIQYQLEKSKCEDCFQQINQLKIQFNSSKALLNKIQTEMNYNSYRRYLQQKGDCISEDQREEDDTVQPLESPSDNKNKYTNIMAHTRQKKWGLMQRTQYEAQRAQSLDQSRKTGISSRVFQDGQDKFSYLNVESNKITVNERLKKMLFN